MSPLIPTIISLQSLVAGLGTGSSEDRIVGTKTSGPSGIDAIISYNGLYLNNRAWIDTYIVNNIEGLDDADVRDSREPQPSDHGEVAGPALYGGRTVVLGGKIETKTLWKLRDMQLALRQAFADISQEMPLTFHSVNPDYDMQIMCKKSQKLNMPEKQDTLNDFDRSFQIYVRASNPRFVSRRLIYGASEESALNGSVDLIAFSAINEGNFIAQPEWALTGPFTTLSIINEATNEIIEIEAAIPSGQTWVINTARNRFYQQSDLVAKFNALSDESSLFNFVVGTNPIRVDSTGGSAASRVEARYRHTVI